jgi:hypothetical protein
MDKENAMNTTTSPRRRFLKSAPMTLVGSLAGIKAALAQETPPARAAQPARALRSPAAKLSKSKRDLMLDVLNTAATPSYIPAGFFMHFGVRGDAAVKAHLDYFHATGMDFVKIQLMHICDYKGTYEHFEARFQDYPGQVVNVPLTADGKPMSLRRAADLFGRPVMGGLDRLGVVSTGSPEEVKEAALEVLKDAPANFILGADCTVSLKTPIENLRTAIRVAHGYRA